MGAEKIIKAFIFCGGEFFPEKIKELPKCDLAIAADSGVFAAFSLGIEPNIVLGDFDSFDKNILSADQKKILEKSEIITFPPKKDLTDSMIAIEKAIEKGADEITIFGALGGRLDHTLSNVFMLKYLYQKGINAEIINGKNAVRYIENCEIELKAKYKYISLMAFGGNAKGVSISGVEYPLVNAALSQEYPYAISNELEYGTDMCRISVKKGALLVVESDE